MSKCDVDNFPKVASCDDVSNNVCNTYLTAGRYLTKNAYSRLSMYAVTCVHAWKFVMAIQKAILNLRNEVEFRAILTRRLSLQQESGAPCCQRRMMHVTDPAQSESSSHERIECVPMSYAQLIVLRIIMRELLCVLEHKCSAIRFVEHVPQVPDVMRRPGK